MKNGRNEKRRILEDCAGGADNPGLSADHFTAERRDTWLRSPEPDYVKGQCVESGGVFSYG